MSMGVGALEAISMGIVLLGMTDEGVIYVGVPVKISFSMAAICLP